jgi:hypothetical protein
METTKVLKSPKAGDYSLFYKEYIELASGRDLKALSEKQESFVKNLYESLSPVQALLSYSRGKWSFNELLGHIIDTEKLMHFRALCISRGEDKNLPGFDQEKYVANANFNAVAPKILLETFLIHRSLLWRFIEQLPLSKLENRGLVSSKPITLAALIHIIFGHSEYHLKLIRKNYLPLVGMDFPL